MTFNFTGLHGFTLKSHFARKPVGCCDKGQTVGHIVFSLLFDNNFAHSKTESAASQDSGMVYNMSIRSSLPPPHIFILRFRPYFCPYIKCLAKNSCVFDIKTKLICLKTETSTYEDSKMVQYVPIGEKLLPKYRFL